MEKTCTGCNCVLDIECFANETTDICRHCTFNNKSKINKKEWYLFEKYCIELHAKKYNGYQVMHWQDIPEELLYKSGFLTPMGGIIEIKRAKMKNFVGKNPYKEFGLDGIATNNTNFHALQMKCYNGSIPIDVFGSFLGVIGLMKKVSEYDVEGHLYYVGKISQQILVTLTINDIKCNQVKEWDHEKLITNKTNPDNIEERYYQTEAIKKLETLEDGLNLINIPCGMGKTYIIQKYINDVCPNNVVVVFCPLIEHINQFYDRMLKISNDPSREILKIDSNLGNNTTRDNDKIWKFINNGYQSLLISTFDSIDVIKDVFDDFDENIMVIVDEVHRITNAIEDFVEKYDNWIGLSGTPLDEQIESAGMNYHIPISTAIEQGFITDYKIYLPFDKKNKDEEIIDDKYWETRCEFIITGMLRKGGRKCIVYCQTQEYCYYFSKVLEKYAMNHHNEEIFVGVITSETSSNVRKSRMDGFEKSQLKINFLFSVRILSECIDIPACDAVYFAQPSIYFNDNSHITTVQRMMRSMRIDSNKPWKYAKIFVFAEDNDKILNMFMRIKMEDINFTKKVSKINSDYAKQFTKESNDKEEIESKNLEKVFIKIKSLDEMWNYKFKLFKKICEKNHELPKQSDEYVGKWLDRQKKQMKNGKMYDSRRIKMLTVKEFNKWYNANKNITNIVIDWNEKFELFKKYCETNHELPKSSNKQLRNWLIVQKTNIKNDKMPKEKYEKILSVKEFRQWYDKNNNIPKKEIIGWDLQYEFLKKYCEVNHELPKFSNDQIGKWLDKQKQIIKNNKMQEERREKILAILEFRQWYDKNKNIQKKEIIDWDDSYLLLKKYCEENNKLPKQINTHIGRWLNSQKTYIKQGKMLEERIKKLLSIKEFKQWFDENKDLPKKEIIGWDSQYDLLKKYCEVNHKLPKYGEIQFGNWLDKQKYSIKTNNMQKDRLSKMLSILQFKEWYDEMVNAD